MRATSVLTLLCHMVILTFCAGHQANSAVIYDQPPRVISGDPGVFSNTAGQTVAEQFLLSFDSIITNVKWFGFYNGADLRLGTTSAGFRLSFYENTAARVDRPVLSPFFREILTSTVTDSGLRVDDPATPRHGGVIYEFETTLPTSIAIGSGEKTWIEITEADDSTPSVGFTQWLWSAGLAEPSTPSAFRNDSLGLSAPWQLGNYPDLAFTFRGSIVPEPSGFVLLGLGILVSLWRTKLVRQR